MPFCFRKSAFWIGSETLIVGRSTFRETMSFHCTCKRRTQTHRCGSSPQQVVIVVNEGTPGTIDCGTGARVAKDIIIVGAYKDFKVRSQIIL